MKEAENERKGAPSRSRTGSLTKVVNVKPKAGTSKPGGLTFTVNPPVSVRFDYHTLSEYLIGAEEEQEVDNALRQIVASRKRSQRTQKQIAKLRERNRALLAKL